MKIIDLQTNDVNDLEVYISTKNFNKIKQDRVIYHDVNMKPWIMSNPIRDQWSDSVIWITYV